MVESKFVTIILICDLTTKSDTEEQSQFLQHKQLSLQEEAEEIDLSLRSQCSKAKIVHNVKSKFMSVMLFSD